VEQEKMTVEVDAQNPIRNALKSFLTLMGFLPDDETLEHLLTHVEKSFLLAAGDKKKTREQHQIYIYSILAHCLIYGQTLEGKVRLTKPFPDCPKSLKGYPLNQTSKKGLEFVCCIVLKIPKSHEPWNSMAQMKLDALLATAEQFIEKYVLTIQDVRGQLLKKREIQETKEIFPTWDLFYPRLHPIRIVPELSSVLLDKIMGLSFVLQQKINDHVSTQLGILVNQAQEPYLINTCCQENNDVYDYLTKHAKIGSTLADLYETLRKYRTQQAMFFANHMYSSMNTKTPIAKIPDAYDERTIYRAIIKIFLFDSSDTIPEKLKKYKLVKPADYKKNDPFEKKMDLLRETPVTEATFLSILRDNATVFERRKGRVLQEVIKGRTPIDDVLGKESDLYDYCTVEIEEKMKFILSKVRDKNEKKKFQQCIQFYTLFRDQKQNDFLPKGLEHKQSLSQILRNKIDNILHVFPQKIINKKYLPTKLPHHWKLDEKHVENILEFTTQYYHNLTTFYEDDTWNFKHQSIDVREYKRWLTLPLSVSMKYTLYSYIYVSLFYDYLQVGLLDYVKIIVGIFLEEDKQAFETLMLWVVLDRKWATGAPCTDPARKMRSESVPSIGGRLEPQNFDLWGCCGLEKRPLDR
jgi:DNA replication initiation complex subunit (GINS family)